MPWSGAKGPRGAWPWTPGTKPATGMVILYFFIWRCLPLFVKSCFLHDGVFTMNSLLDIYIYIHIYINRTVGWWLDQGFYHPIEDCYNPCGRNSVLDQPRGMTLRVLNNAQVGTRERCFLASDILFFPGWCGWYRNIRISQASYLSISLGIAIGNRAKLGTPSWAHLKPAKCTRLVRWFCTLYKMVHPSVVCWWCLPVWYLLVGGLVAIFYFPIYWECHHPTWLIFNRGVAQPPTSLP